MAKLLISRTFSEVTHESAEDGDFSDSGFVEEREEVTFRELVDVLREHPVPSCYPVREVLSWHWASTHGEIDYGTGTERVEAVHWHQDNPPRLAKYWAKAWKLAGVGRR